MGGSFNLYWQPDFLFHFFRSRLVSRGALAALANLMPAAIAHCGLDAFSQTSSGLRGPWGSTLLGGAGRRAFLRDLVFLRSAEFFFESLARISQFPMQFLSIPILEGQLTSGKCREPRAPSLLLSEDSKMNER